MSGVCPHRHHRWAFERGPNLRSGAALWLTGPNDCSVQAPGEVMCVNCECVRGRSWKALLSVKKKKKKKKRSCLFNDQFINHSAIDHLPTAKKKKPEIRCLCVISHFMRCYISISRSFCIVCFFFFCFLINKYSIRNIKTTVTSLF